MRVEIWSDVVCPWCYVGKRRFETALARFAYRDEVEVRWRAFELDPQAPAERTGDYAARLAEKYGTGTAQAQRMVDDMTATAAAEGLEFRFDRARPGNTFAAHRLLHLAAERGLQDAAKERLLHATFTDGEPIGDHQTLVRLVGEVGLDPAEARAVLAGDTYAGEVRAEEAEAQALGITGVPFFVVDRTYGVSGAQPPELLLEVLQRAHADRAGLQLVTPSGDTACEGDDCAI